MPTNAHTYVSHITSLALPLLQHVSALRGPSSGSTTKPSFCKVTVDFTTQLVNLPQRSVYSTSKSSNNFHVVIHLSRSVTKLMKSTVGICVCRAVEHPSSHRCYTRTET